MDVPFESLMQRGMPLARHPTDASPGSAEKMEVMRQRVERGEQVCHPGDAADWTFKGGG